MLEIREIVKLLDDIYYGYDIYNKECTKCDNIMSCLECIFHEINDCTSRYDRIEYLQHTYKIDLIKKEGGVQ